MLKLTPLATITAAIGDITAARGMPIGERQYYAVKGGTVEGGCKASSCRAEAIFSSSIRAGLVMSTFG